MERRRREGTWDTARRDAPRATTESYSEAPKGAEACGFGEQCVGLCSVSSHSPHGWACLRGVGLWDTYWEPALGSRLLDMPKTTACSKTGSATKLKGTQQAGKSDHQWSHQWSVGTRDPSLNLWPFPCPRTLRWPWEKEPMPVGLFKEHFNIRFSNGACRLRFVPTIILLLWPPNSFSVV